MTTVFCKTQVVYRPYCRNLCLLLFRKGVQLDLMCFAFKPCALDHLVLHQESTIGMIDYVDKYHSLIPTSLVMIP